MEAAAVAAMRGGKVRFVALDRQHAPLERDLKAAFTRMLGSSAFTLGAEVERFEADFAEYSQTRHCIGVASGTAALSLMLGAYGIGAGDEVIVPAHTFIASALAVSHVGATPVLVDVLDGTGLMDPDAAPGCGRTPHGGGPGRPSLRTGMRHRRDRCVRQAARPARPRGRGAGARRDLSGPAHRLARRCRGLLVLPQQEPGCARGRRGDLHRRQRTGESTASATEPRTTNQGRARRARLQPPVGWPAGGPAAREAPAPRHVERGTSYACGALSGAARADRQGGRGAAPGVRPSITCFRRGSTIATPSLRRSVSTGSRPAFTTARRFTPTGRGGRRRFAMVPFLTRTRGPLRSCRSRCIRTLRGMRSSASPTRCTRPSVFQGPYQERTDAEPHPGDHSGKRDRGLQRRADQTRGRRARVLGSEPPARARRQPRCRGELDLRPRHGAAGQVPAPASRGASDDPVRSRACRPGGRRGDHRHARAHPLRPGRRGPPRGQARVRGEAARLLVCAGRRPGWDGAPARADLDVRPHVPLQPSCAGGKADDRGRDARRHLLHLLEPREPRPASARCERDLGPRSPRLLDPPLLAQRASDHGARGRSRLDRQGHRRRRVRHDDVRLRRSSSTSS